MTGQNTDSGEWVLVDRDQLNELLQWAQHQDVGPVLKDVQLQLERQLTAEPPEWWFTDAAEEPVSSRRSRRVVAIVAVLIAVAIFVALGAVWFVRVAW